MTDSSARRDDLVREIRSLRPRLHRTAARILRDAAEADDAVQNALLAALRSLDRHRTEAKLSAWLYRITVNAALMQLRSRRSRATRSCPGGVRVIDLVPDGRAGRLDQRLDARRRLTAALRAISALPPDQEAALMMRSALECSTLAVAQELGRSPAAAKMLVHRARQHIREATVSAPRFAGIESRASSGAS